MNRTRLLKNLDKLNALFSGPEKWIQGSFAKTKSGKPVGSNEDSACCWCIAGGVNRITYQKNEEYAEMRAALSETIGGNYALGTSTYVAWNEKPERTFADIKKLIADTKERIVKEAENEVPSA